MRRLGLVAVVVVGAILVPVQDIYAQDPKTCAELMTIRSLKCYFGPGAIATWDDGTCKVQATNTLMRFTFDSIDLRARTARRVEDVSAADVTVLATSSGITITEVTPFGNVMITTVFCRHKDGTDQFIAVHSRHKDMPGVFSSQWHGSCWDYGDKEVADHN